MTAEELQQVKRLVLRDLPRVLEQDPEFALYIEGLLSEKFPRRDEFSRMLDELRESRQENREQFARIDRRLDRTDQRLDGIDQRLDHMDQRQDRMDQRLDRMDQRIDQNFEELKASILALREWTHLIIGGFQNRAGKRLEDVVAGAFCFGLRRGDIRPEHVLLRQKIVDEDGAVYRPGKVREFDLLALGQEIIVFEIKATADFDDIDDLADKVKLIAHLNPDKRVHGVLVMLGAETGHRRLCAEYGLELIP